MAPKGVAARAGRWSARHRKAAIFGWLAFVLVAFAIGGALGTDHLKDEEPGTGESGRAEKTMNEAFPQSVRESVLVQARTGSDDAEIGSTLRELRSRLGDTEGVRRMWR